MTAVEWLEVQIKEQQKSYIDLAKKDKSFKKSVDAILTATTLLLMKCNKAKEIEKEQYSIEFELKQSLMEIELRHTKTLLKSCEETLADRDKEIQRIYSEKESLLVLKAPKILEMLSEMVENYKIGNEDNFIMSNLIDKSEQLIKEVTEL